MGPRAGCALKSRAERRVFLKKSGRGRVFLIESEHTVPFNFSPRFLLILGFFLVYNFSPIAEGILLKCLRGSDSPLNPLGGGGTPPTPCAHLCTWILGYFTDVKFLPFRHFTIIQNISERNVCHAFQASFPSTIVPLLPKLDMHSSIQISRKLDT